MNIRRFTSTTTRQAMALVRAEFGNQAIILRTRSVEGGVEIVAMADEALAGSQRPDSRSSAGTPARAPAPAERRPGAAPRAEGSGLRSPSWAASHQGVPSLPAQGRWSASDRLPPRPGQASSPALPGRPGQAVPAEPMSTLSFQQFVRDRLAHREQYQAADASPVTAHGHGGSTMTAGTFVDRRPQLPARRPDAAREPLTGGGDSGQAVGRDAGREVSRAGSREASREVSRDGHRDASRDANRDANRDVRRDGSSAGSRDGGRHQPPGVTAARTDQAAARRRVPRVIDPGASNQTAHALMMPTASIVTADSGDSDLLLKELRKMRGLMRSQLFSLARSQPDSVAEGLMRRLRDCGFSATLVRRLLEKIPADADLGRAEAWIRQLMVKVIRLDAPHRRILERGGIHALVGPTGVGKTTTVAKLAARFALRHGTDAVGMVTLDTYRIGAHDQLRTFGRLLGIPVGVAHGAAGLASFMSENANRKLILIDTVGVGQRDERLPELIDSTSSASIRKLLVLNAAAQPETLEDVVRAYRVGSRGGIVVSKVDEAVKLGGVVDCLVRHRLPLIGLADGQRVPEDWQEPEVGSLVRRAFDTRTSAVFDYDGVDATAADHA